MKIGMMADVYQTHVSGVTNSILLMKESLEKLGHEVYIFTFGEEDLVDHKSRIVTTSGLPVVDTGFYINLRYSNKARRLLSTMDIAHVHHPFLSGSLAMRYCVPKDIPIVFTNHTRYDLYAQAYIPFLPVQLGDAALKAYLTPFFRACSLVIVPSPSILDVLHDLFDEDTQVAVIPNGVKLMPFRTAAHPIERSRFGFSNQNIVCVYSGRLASEKNVSLLLRAFNGAVSVFERIRLLILGDGPERENLETQVAHMQITDKVHFAGMVEYDNVPSYLAASDIFITPSITETFGLSTVEAMAAGLPVLGVDAPGTSDIIEDRVTGLISPNDTAIFTAKLILMISDTDLRKRMGIQAKKASEKYDIQTTTAILDQHYQQLHEAAMLRKNSNINNARVLDKIP